MEIDNYQFRELIEVLKSISENLDGIRRKLSNIEREMR